MKGAAVVSYVASWVFALAVFVTGLLQLTLVHPVPGVVYLLLSSLYAPPASALLRNRLGFSIPPLVKVILGVILILFTLGVSDLGDMID
ncbi:hypothetical protein [Pontibacter actiniarum]|uniref:Uncharacterized protein n=1 Tax=Pontibacter actiniarum TaxID=323450 RepID=A0A1X9YNF2_9BACT|nr:hypothetical protein [Pontibacter actiniarum]ARS34413.1 hypothetical protein CA264_02565 [Pontibacter actiniarum]